MSAREISRRTGLTTRRVAHGMAELRDKGVIVPVLRRGADGAWRPDRSRFGHVAQYRIADDVWMTVNLQPHDEQTTSQHDKGERIVLSLEGNALQPGSR